MPEINKDNKKIVKVESGHRISEYVKSNEYIAAIVDGTLRDLSDVLESGGDAILIHVDSDEGMRILRHSAAHLLAHAVTEIYTLR